MINVPLRTALVGLLGFLLSVSLALLLPYVALVFYVSERGHGRFVPFVIGAWIAVLIGLLWLGLRRSPRPFPLGVLLGVASALVFLFAVFVSSH